MTEVRNVRSPLTDEMLRPKGATTHLQFRDALALDDYGRLDDWFATYPEVNLSVSSYEATSLDSLEHLPSVRKLSVDIGSLES